MALTREEQQIIEYGRQNEKTREQILQALTKYRVQNPPREAMQEQGFSEALVDVAETAGEVTEQFRQAGENIVGIARSNLTLGEKARGIGAETFRRVGRAIGSAAIGAGKVLLPQRAEEAVSKGAEVVGREIGQTKFVQNLIQKYQALPPDVQREVDNALGFAEGLAEISTGGVAGRVVRKGIGAAVETAEIGVRGAGTAIRRITPQGIKNLYSRLQPVSKDEAIRVLTDSYEKSFIPNRPAINNKLDGLVKSVSKKGEPITRRGLLENLAKEGYIPVVEGKLARFDHVLDDIALRQSRLAESIDPVLRFVPQKTKLNDLKKVSQTVLKTSPQIGGELNKALRELDSFFESFRTRYGDELSALEVNEIRKQMNRRTRAFSDEIFKQDVADAVADATRKRLDELIPSGNVKLANTEIGRLFDLKKTAGILHNQTIDVGVIGGQLGRYIGVMTAAGIGFTAAGPGGLVIAGIAAHYGGNVVAQMLRNVRFTERTRELIIQGIKQDDEIVKKLIKEADGENKAFLERILLLPPEKTSIPLGPKKTESSVRSVPAAKGEPSRVSTTGRFQKTFLSTPQE